jgi:hypothetical protein
MSSGWTPLRFYRSANSAFPGCEPKGEEAYPTRSSQISRQ